MPSKKSIQRRTRECARSEVTSVVSDEQNLRTTRQSSILVWTTVLRLTRKRQPGQRAKRKYQPSDCLSDPRRQPPFSCHQTDIPIYLSLKKAKTWLTRNWKGKEPKGWSWKENIDVLRTMIKEHDQQAKEKATPKKLIYDDSGE
ncbi:hypothetical protein Tco_1389892 [Tanacetum coccineum]